MSSSLLNQTTISASQEDLQLVFKEWPENFLGLYDMGFRSFERLFNHRPQLMAAMGLPSDDSWKKNEKIKKIVLSLEQTLVEAVATYADPAPEHTTQEFCDNIQEIGGFHRAIVPSISPDNFELLFKLLPEVIADVTSSRRESGPLKADERNRLLGVWNGIAGLMSKFFVMGWERRVVPKKPKFLEIYRSEKQAKGEQRRSSADQLPKQRSDPNPGGSGIPKRFAPRSGPHRSSTQVEMRTSGGSYLERGNSAPIALHDLILDFQELSTGETNPD